VTHRSLTRRLLAHIATDHLSVRRAFPRAALGRIEEAIAAGERLHRAQICFAVEAALHPAHVLRRLTPRERALEAFGLLRVWDTEENAGVLIYLLLADRDIEIVADRGAARAAGPHAFEPIAAHMEEAFAGAHFADGVVAGIGELSALLARHFPRLADGPNELPDRAVVL
jgi:uncharacterized membrane protein